MLSQLQPDSHSENHHGLAVVFLSTDGLTHFLILRGSMEQDTNLLPMCSYLLENTADSSVCFNSFKERSGILLGHLNTKLNPLCILKTCKEAQKPAMNSMLLVFSCILVLTV